MSISIITEPQELTPAYNDAFVVVDSTNKTEEAFRYVAEVYVNNQLVKTDRIYPDPSNNDRGKIYFGRVAQSYLSYLNKIPLSAPIVSVGVNRTYINVRLEIGEEYIGDAWSYTGFGFAGAVNWTNFNNPAFNPNGLSRTMLFNATGEPEPPYEVGDYIFINQNDDINQQLSGVHIVLDKEQISTSGIEWILVLGLPWQQYQTPSSFEGSTRYADNRKVVNMDLTTDTYILFNGSVEHHLFPSWQSDEYLTNDEKNKFLTTMPRNGWKIRPTSKAYLQFWDIQSEATREVKFEYAGGDDTYTFSGVDKVLYLTDAMPSRITASLLPDSYEVYITEDSIQNSEKILFNIDERCYEFESVEILFMDRLGSMLPFYFSLKHTEVDTNKKKYYDKVVESRIMYNYSLQDGGQVAYEIDLDTIYTIRTDALTVDEARYLGELVSSGYTLIRFGEGDYLRCNVLTSSHEYKDEFNNGLRFYTLEVKLANVTKVNW